MIDQLWVYRFFIFFNNIFLSESYSPPPFRYHDLADPAILADGERISHLFRGDNTIVYYYYCYYYYYNRCLSLVLSIKQQQEFAGFSNSDCEETANKLRETCDRNAVAYDQRSKYNTETVMVSAYLFLF